MVEIRYFIFLALILMECGQTRGRSVAVSAKGGGKRAVLRKEQALGRPFRLGYNGLKTRSIAAEPDKEALKGEIACIGDEVARLNKAATRLLREKHKMWQSISELQSTITSDMERASKLADEGVEVSGEEAALLALYSKMQHYRLAVRN